jgi:hypothetical protein
MQMEILTCQTHWYLETVGTELYCHTSLSPPHCRYSLAEHISAVHVERRDVKYQILHTACYMIAII